MGVWHGTYKNLFHTLNTKANNLTRSHILIQKTLYKFCREGAALFFNQKPIQNQMQTCKKQFCDPIGAAMCHGDSVTDSKKYCSQPLSQNRQCLSRYANRCFRPSISSAHKCRSKAMRGEIKLRRHSHWSGHPGDESQIRVLLKRHVDPARFRNNHVIT